MVLNHVPLDDQKQDDISHIHESRMKSLPVASICTHLVFNTTHMGNAVFEPKHRETLVAKPS